MTENTKGFVLAIGEVYLGVLEVQQRGGVGTVVYRTQRLHLKVAFHGVVGIFLDCEKQTAFYFLVGRELRVGEHGGVHILVHGLLECFKHLFVCTGNLVGVDCYRTVQLLGGSRHACP